MWRARLALDTGKLRLCRLPVFRRELVRGVRSQRGKQCFHTLGILSVLPGATPTAVKLRVQFLAYRLAMIDKPRNRWPIAGGNAVRVAESRETACGRVVGRDSSLLLAPRLRLTKDATLQLFPSADTHQPVFIETGRFPENRVDSCARLRAKKLLRTKKLLRHIGMSARVSGNPLKSAAMRRQTANRYFP